MEKLIKIEKNKFSKLNRKFNKLIKNFGKSGIEKINIKIIKELNLVNSHIDVLINTIEECNRDINKNNNKISNDLQKKIKNNEEINEIINKFLPYMLLYQLNLQ